MSLIDRAIRSVSPRWALSRARSRQALALMDGYAATKAPNLRIGGRRSGDADTLGRERASLAWLSRDLIRNTPLAARAQQVIASNVVGDGIIAKVTARDARAREELLSLIERHFDTTAIDADGRQNLYGLQRLALNAVVDAGEVLIRRRRRLLTDGLALPFQLQLLEPEFLDGGRDQLAAPPRDGRPGRNLIREGIEYDAIGRRVAYWLHDEHPGASLRGGESRRVPASEVLHVYRQDRPGQMRGVTWFAPVMLTLRDFADYQDAQLVRQQIAACFTAFRTIADGTVPEGQPDDFGGLDKLSPGLIRTLAPGEDVRFAEPPGVSGYDEFTRGVLRATAAGLGITYEALTGDLANVNFSSGRMGRMEMDRNVSAWQWLLMVPQMLQPLAAWTLEAWGLSSSRARPARLDWVPPARIVVDPNREYSAMRDLIRSGLTSRSASIRALGYDAERVEAEIAEDNRRADEMGLVFDSDPRRTAAAGTAQSAPTGDEPEGEADG